MSAEHSLPVSKAVIRSAWEARGQLLVTRFDELGLATIKDLPTQRFHEIVDVLIAAGWEKVDEYAGMDAWIDYGSIDLLRGDDRLHCEWDNWSEGSVEGKRATIEALGAQHGLPVAYQSRWDNT